MLCKRFLCFRCGRTVQAPAEWVRPLIRCRNCGGVFRLPRSCRFGFHRGLGTTGLARFTYRSGN